MLVINPKFLKHEEFENERKVTTFTLDENLSLLGLKFTAACLKYVELNFRKAMLIFRNKNSKY